MPQVDMNAVAKGLPEPSPPEMLKTSASPATIKTAEPDMVNPDEWYNNKLKGLAARMIPICRTAVNHFPS